MGVMKRVCCCCESGEGYVVCDENEKIQFFMNEKCYEEVKGDDDRMMNLLLLRSCYYRDNNCLSNDENFDVLYC